MVGIFVWGVIDRRRFVDYGEIKPGFKIRDEPLSPTRLVFLESLTRDIIEESWLPSGSKTTSFIQVYDGQVLIRCQSAGWRTAWPYVGYVDLREENPVIEYRSSLPMHLLLLPFVLTIIAIPFIGLMMVVNYRMERGAILGFIDEQMTLSASKGNVP
jgi:hypothetical protein